MGESDKMPESCRTLDVGCGDKPTGDINIDIGPIQINTHPPGLATRANIFADAQHLPFRDSIFSLAYSSHTLEHLSDPRKALVEMERVASRVVVIVPHRYCVGNNRNPSHLWGFTDTWFRKMGYEASVSWTMRRVLWFGAPWLNEITATKRSL